MGSGKLGYQKQAAGEEGLLPRETAAPVKINSLARAGHGGYAFNPRTQQPGPYTKSLRA